MRNAVLSKYIKIKFRKRGLYIKKLTTKIISFILTLSMIFSTAIPAFAAETPENLQTLIEMQDEYGTLKITYEVTSSGDQIFSEYINNVLTTQNIISLDNPNLVNQTNYGNNSPSMTRSINSINNQSTYLISDYINESSPRGMQPFKSSGTKLGRINYRSSDMYEGTIYYSLDVSYTSRSSLSTYTVRSFAGKLVDLVTIVVSAIALPKAMVATFIKRLLVSAGIAVTGGTLSKSLSTTMSSIKTTYNMYLQNPTVSGHNKTVNGYKYYISDDNYPSARGEIYYEGYVPNDWKKQHLAVWLHNEMFAYSFFDVVSWR